MSLTSLRSRLAASLGLAVVTTSCTSKPAIVTAPTASVPLPIDAAAPEAPGKLVDLPLAPRCEGYQRPFKHCEDELTSRADSHYPAPYANCRIAASFDAAATDESHANKSNKCCYLECHSVIRGRPFRAHDGTEQLASRSVRDDWRAELRGLTVLPSEERAAYWSKAALAEHASVAAFSQLSLQLMALGAPPQLLAATHHAALDEVRHAEIAFAFASMYGGASVGPSPMIVNALAYRGLRELATETLVDGCIGEAASALALGTDARQDADAGALLDQIVSDEERHVALAWQIVRWALRKEPALESHLERALELAKARPGLEGQVAREVAAPIFVQIVAEARSGTQLIELTR